MLNCEGRSEGKIRRKVARVSGAALLLVCMSAPAGPQVGGASKGIADSAAKTNDSDTWEEIVVIARRRVEPLQQVPIAVTVLEQEALERNRIQSLSDLQLLVPSATVSGYQNRNQEFFTLRGQGETGLATGGGTGGGPAVVGYLSEVPAPIAGPGLYHDLQSVQVLKGPQGTLFGRNTTGGAILFEPRRPEPIFGGDLQITLGDFDRREFKGALNLPLGETLAIRIAGNIGERDGYTRDVVTGVEYDDRDFEAARIGVLFEPAERFENYFVANYVAYEENGPGNILIAANPANPALAAELDAQRARGIRSTSHSVDQLNQGSFLNLLNKTSLDLNESLTLRNIVSWSRRRTRRQDDEDGSPLVILDSLGSQPGTWNIDLRTVTEELQLQGEPGERLVWQLGGYYEDSENPENQTFTQQFGSAFNNNFRSDLESESRGLYAQATVGLDALLEGLKLTVGYRHTWDEVFQGIALAGGTSRTPIAGDPCFTKIGATYPDCYVSDSAEHDGDSYTFGVDYQASPEVLLYVVTRKGYKSGGFNIVATILGDTGNPFFTYDPETVKDVEIGLKADWSLGDARGRTNLALYDSRYEDAQVLTAAVVGGSPQGLTANAAEASIQGAEIESSLRLTRSFELDLTYSYLDADYDKYITPLGVDLTDTPYPYAPRHKVSAGARARVPLPAMAGEVWLGATYVYQSEIYVGIGTFGAGSPANTQPSFGLINAQAEWFDVMGSKVDLSVFATNLTDEEYQVSAIDLYNATGASAATFGEPRMIGASLSYRF